MDNGKDLTPMIMGKYGLNKSRTNSRAWNPFSCLTDDYNPHPAVQNVRRPASGIPTSKRFFDLTFIALTTPCWLPLMLIIALGIKIVSPGPIYFCQERVGYRGRRFVCFKFRSMKVNADTQAHEDYLAQLMQEDRPMTKLDAAGDPRLIPYGRLFRATGLDELPQIFNVIRGEMCLVGPRPCTRSEYDSYSHLQQKRFHAPAGITGYWQVSGKNKTTFSEMIEMDINYANNMSIWLDLWIILKTVPVLTCQIFETRVAPCFKRQQQVPQ